MTEPNIVAIVNKSPEPIPASVMNVIGEMRLKIDAKFPGRKFNFIVDKIEGDKWDIQIQFEKPLAPDGPTTKD
jgi:hypothetical protein